MTEEQLYTLLDSYKKRVSSNEDRKLFVEAVRVAKAAASRAPYFTLWISYAKSLKHRFKDLSKRDPISGKLPVEILSMEAA